MPQTLQHRVNTNYQGLANRLGAFLPKCYFSHFIAASELSVFLCMGHRAEEL